MLVTVQLADPGWVIVITRTHLTLSRRACKEKIAAITNFTVAAKDRSLERLYPFG